MEDSDIDAITCHNITLTQPINEVAQLDSRTREYILAGHSPSTRKAYRNDLHQFLRWGGSIPSTPEFIASYLTYHAPIRKPATLSRWLVSLSLAHTSKELSDPVDTDLVRAVSRGIRRVQGTKQRRVTPILKADLLSMLDSMGDRPKDIRDRALLLIGFAGALRRSELVNLDVEDIKEVREGLTILIRKSKTDQEGEGRTIGIPFARGSACPVKAVKTWLGHSGITDGPIFRSMSRGGKVGKRLSGYAVSLIVKQRVAAIGLVPTDYSGHSLRSGLATSSAAAGIPAHKIMAQTGHKSEAMLNRYVRDGRMFIDNAAGIL